MLSSEMSMQPEEQRSFQAKVQAMSFEELTALHSLLLREGIDAPEEMHLLQERIRQRSVERRHRHHPGKEARD